jgi:hypothetical protein
MPCGHRGLLPRDRVALLTVSQRAGGRLPRVRMLRLPGLAIETRQHLRCLEARDPIGPPWSRSGPPWGHRGWLLQGRGGQAPRAAGGDDPSAPPGPTWTSWSGRCWTHRQGPRRTLAPRPRSTRFPTSQDGLCNTSMPVGAYRVVRSLAEAARRCPEEMLITVGVDADWTPCLQRWPSSPSAVPPWPHGSALRQLEVPAVVGDGPR